MQFFSGENENTLLQQCLEGSVGLVNLVFEKLPPTMRQQLNGLVFSGAQVVVSVELSPCPSVVCLVSAHGQSLELFKIESPVESQSETTH